LSVTLPLTRVHVKGRPRAVVVSCPVVRSHVRRHLCSSAPRPAFTSRGSHRRSPSSPDAAKAVELGSRSRTTTVRFAGPYRITERHPEPEPSPSSCRTGSELSAHPRLLPVVHRAAASSSQPCTPLLHVLVRTTSPYRAPTGSTPSLSPSSTTALAGTTAPSHRNEHTRASPSHCVPVHKVKPPASTIM
jgi:hypothetical protein